MAVRVLPLLPLPLLLLLVSDGLRAQTARPAPADSIYALRVDPAAHPGQDYVLLLEDGSARLEADGRSSYTVRQVAQVLTPDGAASWGEFAFWYVPERQRVRINWIRVIGPDGTVLRDGPEHQQETSPTVDQGAPVYSEQRAIQATLGGVTPGTPVDYSYTLETLRPQLPGDFRYYFCPEPQCHNRFCSSTTMPMSACCCVSCSLTRSTPCTRRTTHSTRCSCSRRSSRPA